MTQLMPTPRRNKPKLMHKRHNKALRQHKLPLLSHKLLLQPLPRRPIPMQIALSKPNVMPKQPKLMLPNLHKRLKMPKLTR